MIFNQFGFLFVFLPVVLGAFYFPLLRPWRPQVLIVASFVFYGISGINHAVVLALDVVWVYWVIRTDGIVGNRLRLALAVTPPFLALFYFKYLGFFAGQFAGIGSREAEFSLFTDILLPAGISFFTFQLASVAIDRYRGEVREMPSFRLFATYIAFFPQLVAGPILRFRDVSEPLKNLLATRLDWDAAARAIGYVCLGLAVKVLIADTIDHYLNPLIKAPDGLSAVAAVYVVFAYSFQIYFDFYGYSLIAIGLGSLFGFRFPDNFLRPYESLNPKDFWRRWHVTLSFWIRDYLYYPLGGNRQYLRNIVAVFAICGLWHGAGWNFIVWGLFHAVLVSAYHVGRRWWDALPRMVQWAGTFSAVSLGWVLFVFDLKNTVKFLHSLAGQADVVVVADPSFDMWMILAVAVAACFGMRIERHAENPAHGRAGNVARNAAFAGLLMLVLMFLDRSQTFVYFRF